ncbi:MAG: UbiX family flavin prenyltransferase [Quisquiliibacterium sp.]
MKQAKDLSPRRLIVGIAGASGVIYGVRALELLREAGIETHLVMSRAAELTLACETKLKPRDVEALASVVHAPANIGASIASGSFPTMGMLVLPCSTKTMSEIACGITSTLLTRAADVVLKERRRLVLGLRETPLHTGHLRNMTQASEIGAIIAPIVPAFYTNPKSIQDIIDHSVGRLLELFDIQTGTVRRWPGPPRKSAGKSKP